MSTNPPLDKSIRQWGMACHLSALASIVIGVVLPIPFLGVLIPYIVWKMGRDRHPFIDDQGRAAVNFQLSMSIYLVSVFILFLILLFTTCAVYIANINSSSDDFLATTYNWTLIAGSVFLVLFGLFQFCVIVFASVKALQGQSYQYPFTSRFLQ
jgi:hypothetical protein